MRRALPALSLLSVLILAACGSPGPRSASPTASRPTPTNPNPAVVQKRGGGYYMDDGPGDNPPANLELTPDAVPRDEPPLKSAANRPYVVFGKTYTPTLDTYTFRQRGIASWYGRKFHGQRTSSGEPYDMYGMTAAHPTLPIPSYVRVTNLSNGRTVVVKVNDRGPFHSERIIDLSYTAAYKLGYLGQGSTMVEIEQVHGDGTPLPPVLVAAAPATVTTGAVGGTVSPVAAAGTVVASSAPSAAAAVVNPVTPTAQPAPVLMPSDKLSPGANTAGAPVVVTAPVAQTRAALPAPAASLPAAPPASPPPTQTLPTSTQPDGVYLQLGAFGARDGADEFRTKIYQQLGWLNDTVYIVARDRLFRVQVGPYKDRAAAAAVAEKIRESLQFTPMFVLK